MPPVFDWPPAAYGTMGRHRDRPSRSRSYTWMYWATPAAQLPGADGHYNWLFARSLAYDGDFDFRNDYRACGDPFDWNHPTATGRANNSYYVGPAVFLTPVIWFLHHAMKFAEGAPADWVAGCRGAADEVGPSDGRLSRSPHDRVHVPMRAARVERRGGCAGRRALRMGERAARLRNHLAALRPCLRGVRDVGRAASVGARRRAARVDLTLARDGGSARRGGPPTPARTSSSASSPRRSRSSRFAASGRSLRSRWRSSASRHSSSASFRSHCSTSTSTRRTHCPRRSRRST